MNCIRSLSRVVIYVLFFVLYRIHFFQIFKAYEYKLRKEKNEEVQVGLSYWLLYRNSDIVDPLAFFTGCSSSTLVADGLFSHFELSSRIDTYWMRMACFYLDSQLSRHYE